MNAGDDKIRQPQANVRLTAAEQDVVRALAFLDGTSASEVLRPAVSSYLLQRAEEPEVKEALAVLKRRRKRTGETKLTSIRDRIARREGA